MHFMEILSKASSTMLSVSLQLENTTLDEAGQLLDLISVADWSLPFHAFWCSF